MIKLVVNPLNTVTKLALKAAQSNKNYREVLRTWAQFRAIVRAWVNQIKREKEQLSFNRFCMSIDPIRKFEIHNLELQIEMLNLLLRRDLPDMVYTMKSRGLEEFYVTIDRNKVRIQYKTIAFEMLCDAENGIIHELRHMLPVPESLVKYNRVIPIFYWHKRRQQCMRHLHGLLEEYGVEVVMMQ